MHTLQIIDLWAKIEDKVILKGVNLLINTNEVHVVMGPNGMGKSTLAAIIMGHPRYEIIKGDILFDNISIKKMSTDERARCGLFLAYQYPSEIKGVLNSDFIYNAMKANKQDVSLFKFATMYEKTCEKLKINDRLANRYLNDGFSGGEKKKNEIIQMLLLKPHIAILDEIDSGLDVDALKIVGENVSSQVGDNFGCLIITHYQRLLEYIKPNFIHILIDGKICMTGDEKLLQKIDKEGYDWVYKELNLKIEKETKISLGTCAVKK